MIICTCCRPTELRKCLGAVSKLLLAPDEVLVIDNTDGDPDTERVVAEFGAKYIVEPTRGLSRARNRGFAESKSDVVLYFDDDAEPDEAWLERLLSPFVDRTVALVTGRIVSGAEILTPPGDETWTVSKGDPYWFEIAAFGGLGSGSNMAIRRAAVETRLPFDERLGSGAPFEQGEENFAFVTLLNLGYRAIHVPTAIVYHPEKEFEVESFAARSFAFWLLLMAEFPTQRGTLIRFLWRRFRRIPLPWPRHPQQAGAVILAGWRVYARALLQGTLLFLRYRKGPR